MKVSFILYEYFHSYVKYLDTNTYKKSLDPALDKKYSSSVYSKQMSLDESNTNENFTNATKRYGK